MEEQDILTAVSAGESHDWEFKSAKGGVPASVWETYSAMANTDGGTIVLGIGEHDHKFHVEGLKKADQALKTSWDCLNDRGKISVNLLSENMIRMVNIHGKNVLVIQVPRADRRKRPVYIGQNPMNGTFRRNFEGDYKCRPDEVGRMLADQSDEPADSRVLPFFGIDDLDAESFSQYRNRFSARNPNHAWLNEDATRFLQKLGGWSKNRESGEEGLTIAGLLMFGNEDALNGSSSGLKYNLDYRERPTNDIADRWTDRITIDGTWTPNLLRFFQRVYPKLTADLKLPFAYKTDTGDGFADPVRSGQSPTHEAIQEALVNALIHADYRGIGGVVIERFVDRIELSNPGSLLVSIEQLREGGISECRNPSLQKMFQLIGAGDKAGSGVDKIRHGWEIQHWRSPIVSESFNPDRVIFILPMVSLIPKESESRLRHMFGKDYETLSPIEIQTLVTADLEGGVSNTRLQLVRMEHPVELTKMLQSLTARGFLDQSGQKRGAIYRLPNWAIAHDSGASPLTTGASPLTTGASPLTTGASPLTTGASPLITGASPLTPGPPPMAMGAFPVALGAFRAGVESDPENDPKLVEIARPAREKPRLTPELTKTIVRKLCSGRYLTAAQLGMLMDRSKDKLQEKFLTVMVAEGDLTLRFPDHPTHSEQAYKRKED